MPDSPRHGRCKLVSLQLGMEGLKGSSVLVHCTASYDSYAAFQVACFSTGTQELLCRTLDYWKDAVDVAGQSPRESRWHGHDEQMQLSASKDGFAKVRLQCGASPPNSFTRCSNFHGLVGFWSMKGRQTSQELMKRVCQVLSAVCRK